MEKRSKQIKYLLLLAGVIEIIMGFGHFLLPGFIYLSKGFQYLDASEKDIVTLCTLSVGILLIAVGCISVLCSEKYTTNKALVFNIASINLLLWSARIIFEIMYPVKITLLSVKNPTVYAMPVFIALWIIIGLSIFFMWTDKQERNSAPPR